MNDQTIRLPTPETITTNADGEYSFEIYLKVNKGGRYRATCGVPLDPLTAHVSIEPVDPTKTEAVCMVRSVEWAKYSLYICFEVVDRTRWLNTGELKPWEDPLEICYAVHGKLKK